ncbi:MAG: AAA family ATPase, partial [Planctomycetota bacterium]
MAKTGEKPSDLFDYVEQCVAGDDIEGGGIERALTRCLNTAKEIGFTEGIDAALLWLAEWHKFEVDELQGVEEESQKRKLRVSVLKLARNIVEYSSGFAKNSPPRLLPQAAVGKFYGRRKEKNQLVQLLRDRRDTSVVGQAGYGKTALAAEAVAQVVGRSAEELSSSPFPDGVVYLNLYTSQCDFALLYAHLADALGGRESDPNEAPRNRALRACRGQQILVIVEGAELADGEDGRPVLNELLSVLSPENCSLVLTRDKIQTLGTRCVELDETLNDTDAGNLLNALSGKRTAEHLRDRILALLDGHPLAITWAGGLLSLGDEDASWLVEEWERDPTLRLNDPENAEHTLEWLYERSVRGLNELTRQVLSVAASLASDAFSVEMVQAAFEVEERIEVREAIKRLIHLGLIRLANIDGHRQFAHVLAYQFSRCRRDVDRSILERMAQFLRERLSESLTASELSADDLQRNLQHASAILRADSSYSLWMPLGDYLLYDGAERLTQVGRLEWSRLTTTSMLDWLGRKVEIDSDSFWQREHSISFNKLGDLALAEGNLPEARRLFSDALAVAKRFAESDPGDASWQRDLSVSFNKLGDLAIAEGSLPEARRLFSDALSVRQRLAESDPGNASWQRDLSVAFNKLGDLAIAEGNLPEARRLFSDALTISQHLSGSTPGNAGWQRDVSVSLERLGNLALAEGNLPEARRLFSDALAVARHLSE